MGKVFRFNKDVDTDQIIASQYLLYPTVDEMKAQFVPFWHLPSPGSSTEIPSISAFPPLSATASMTQSGQATRLSWIWRKAS